MSTAEDALQLFWSSAATVERQPTVTRSTMMGFPCLRIGKDFFASVEHKGTRLIVKRSKSDVEDIIARGGGEPFAPAGRVFREWVAIPFALHALWPQHISEALAFVTSKKTPAMKTPAKKTPAKKTPAKKTAAKKPPAKKTPAKKTPVKKTPAKKTVAKKTVAKKAPRS